jgi:heat shock protein HslJ
MQRLSDLQGLQRVAAVAIGFILMTAACGGSDLPDLSTSVDQTSASTAAPSTAATDAPADDEPPPAVGGNDRGAELIGRWEVTHYVLPDGGGLTNVVGADPVFMEFSADGTLLYNTGCNSGGTTYSTSGSYLVPESALDDTPEGQPIVIGPSFEQTEIGCEGFLGDQDVDFPADMVAATRFRIDGDQLLLLDEFLLIEATKAG